MPEMTEFDVTGDRVTCGYPEYQRLYSISRQIRVAVGHTGTAEGEGFIEIVYFQLHAKGVGGKLLSNEFNISSGGEEIRITQIPGHKLFRDSPRFLLTIPLHFDSFQLKAPDFEIDGVRHDVPIVEFQKVTGERKIVEAWC